LGRLRACPWPTAELPSEASRVRPNLRPYGRGASLEGPEAHPVQALLASATYLITPQPNITLQVVGSSDDFFATRIYRAPSPRHPIRLPRHVHPPTSHPRAANTFPITSPKTTRFRGPCLHHRCRPRLTSSPSSGTSPGERIRRRRKRERRKKTATWHMGSLPNMWGLCHVTRNHSQNS
jgi:hypothetical protein